MARERNGRGLCTIFARLLFLMTALRMAAGLPPGLSPIPSSVAALYDSGSYRRAADALRAAVEQSPKDASLYYWLGRCYFETRDFGHAISSWEQAVALESDRSEYHDWLGRAYGRKAEQDSHTKMVSALSLAKKTHHEFEVAVQLNPENIDAQRDLIAFIASAPSDLGGGEGQAQEQIRSLSAVDPAEAKLALADLYARRKKFEQASAEYQKAFESASNRVAVDFEIADYYRDRDDSAHMEQAVVAAEKAAPRDRRLSYYRGVLLVLEKKDPGTAEKDLRTYIQTVPDNSELPARSSAYEYLGRLYEDQGQPDLAAEQYNAGLMLDPQNKSLREGSKRLQKR